MMGVVEFLEKFEADYTLEEGRAFAGVRQVVTQRFFGGVEVARVVVIRADRKRYMCVLPSDCGIDMGAVKEQLGASDVDLVDDEERRRIFPCCQSGAEPALGAPYGLPTLLDASLAEDQYIAFQGETHDKAIIMSMAEYRRLASPRVFSFARLLVEAGT